MPFQSMMKKYIGLFIYEHSILFSKFLVCHFKMKQNIFAWPGRRSRTLRLVSIAVLSVTRAQCSALRHAPQENNKVRDDHVLSYGS